MSTLTDRINDFPDRLSPMLVKELRQGLRAKAFVAVFLVLQALLGVILLTASLGSASARAGEVISSIVFVLFSLAVLVIQPLRGIGALSSEIRGQTIDLMVLTRLSAMRIVLGKWVAIVSQSALMAATIIPYLILRFYFGGMALFEELFLVVLVFFLSCGFTAVTVGLSACSSVLVRGILPLLGIIPVIASIFSFGTARRLGLLTGKLSFSDPEVLLWLGLILFTIAYVAWSMLSLGASLIAPHAENHATPRRLIALASMLLVLGIAGTCDVSKMAVPWIWAVIAGPAILLALTEGGHLVPSVARPFVRKGVFGRFCGRLLYPGWQSGVLFTALLGGIGLVAAVMIGEDPPPSTMGHIMGFGTIHAAILVLGYLGSLLLPALVITLAGQRVKDRVSAFILFTIGFSIFSMVIFGVTDGMGSDSAAWAFVWMPAMLPMMLGEHWSDADALLTAAVPVNAVYLAVLFLFSLKSRGEILKAEQEALNA